MKKTSILMLAILTILASLGFANFALASFPDVAGNHIHIQGINYGQSSGFFEGYPDGTFQPDNPINRAEFTKIIVNAIFPDEATGSDCFPDVADEWFASYVCFAQANGILDGYPDGYFKPADDINFSEGAKVIVNTFGYDIDTSDPIWYKPFVQELGVRRAIPTTITDFGQLMTRGEMAEIIYRLAEEITDKPSQTYETIESGEEYDPYLSYESSALGFKVEYLETWLTVEDISSGLPSVFFVSPASEEGDFQEFVSVVIEDLTGLEFTLDEYSDLSLAQIETLFPGYNQISYEDTSLEGESAKMIVYTHTVEGVEYKAMQIWTISGEVAYVLSYSSLESTYDVFEEEANDIFDSFEFL